VFLILGSVVIYFFLVWVLHAFSNTDLLLFKRLVTFPKVASSVQPEPAVIDLKE
jgi:hypothetical protein